MKLKNLRSKQRLIASICWYHTKHFPNWKTTLMLQAPLNWKLYSFPTK